MQPFRSEARFESRIWDGVVAELIDDRIVIHSAEPLRTLSNSVYRGGEATARQFVNWRVPLTYNSDHPTRDIEQQLAEWQCEASQAVVLMTAAKLTHASIMETENDRFRMFCLTTAGTSNAARAGSQRKVYDAWRPGTINTFLLFDGQLGESAMVNALMTAVEAKAAAIQDIGLRDSDNGLTATGTTTDAIVIGVSGSRTFGAIHDYAGTATTVGAAVGRLVYETVYESVQTQHQP
ncbi:protein of unknown function DUF105 [Paenibacillus curdlanolyticus YK9]|uniref:Adenosylcobinamide amidohydrolase n=1 Tax=Paenibacillus curdlanolyticus YK9 TaxID=717606 RepID=E0I4F2_9BACL|nr:adenosylcobinamide amidohydrolase [Paenibacillus curdlanolyticus]EFM13166.1 protein of unknown function DUF105 [Paenibacillus curdlanolyticus YK9]